MIYITPYDIPSKVCQAVSGTMPSAKTVDDAAALLTYANTRIVTRSPRLVLIDLDGVNGLAVSDIPYVKN